MTSLGGSLGGYFLDDGEVAEWILFEHGVWDRKRNRVVHFSQVEQLLPKTLTPEYKLLHFSPTLVFSDAPPLHLRCQGRESGELNHGWAICSALRDIFSALMLE